MLISIKMLWNHQPMKCKNLPAFILLFPLFSFPQKSLLVYTVSMENPGWHYFHADLNCSGIKKDSIDFKMPVRSSHIQRIININAAAIIPLKMWKANSGFARIRLIRIIWRKKKNEMRIHSVIASPGFNARKIWARAMRRKSPAEIK